MCTSGGKNMSILHLSCRTSDNFHSSCKHMHLSFRSVCNQEQKGVIYNMISSSNSSQSSRLSALGRITSPFYISLLMSGRVEFLSPAHTCMYSASVKLPEDKFQYMKSSFSEDNMPVNALDVFIENATKIV